MDLPTQPPLAACAAASPVPRPRVAVVLFNLGGPDAPESVRPFLVNLFTDPAILRVPGWIRPWLGRIIAWRRTKPASENYDIIGGKSPLLELTLEQAAALGRVSSSELAAAAGVSSSVVKGLVGMGALEEIEEQVDLPFPAPNPDLPGAVLTGEQASAAEELREGLRKGGFSAYLLDGVTGSGKTEVYFEAIAEVLRSDSEAQILVLLPEIALTQAILARFEQRFGAGPAPWHSGLNPKERRRTMREVLHGRARIVIGARSALFLPFRKLKLVIVDEEHDGSYKQEDGVTYHARDLAVMRAKLEEGAVVLASATPALETVVNAEAGRYIRLRLAARPGTARLPEIELIDLT
jgi:primosomal protein N' (replication factor Y)